MRWRVCVFTAHPAAHRCVLKTITLTAKDKICPLEERVCTPEACPRADGYYDRINAALYRFFVPNRRIHPRGYRGICPAKAAVSLRAGARPDQLVRLHRL